MTHKKENVIALAILAAGTFLTLQPLQAQAADAADIAVILNAGTYTMNASDTTSTPSIGGSGILGNTAGTQSPNGLAATAGLGVRLSQRFGEDMRVYGELGEKQLEHGKQGQYLSAGIDKRVYTTASGDVEVAVGALVGARKSDVTGSDQTNTKLGLTATAESRNGFGVRATLYPTSEFGHAGTTGTGSGTTTGILAGMNGGSSDGASVTLDFTFAFNK
jgi:hypothetical protein